MVRASGMGTGAICPTGSRQVRIFGNDRNSGRITDPFGPRNLFSHTGLVSGGSTSRIQFFIPRGGGVDAVSGLVEGSSLDFGGDDSFCRGRPWGSFGGGRARATPFWRGSRGANLGRPRLDASGTARAIAAGNSADGWGGQLLVGPSIEVCPDGCDGCFGGERSELADSICGWGNESRTCGPLAGTNPPSAP